MGCRGFPGGLAFGAFAGDRASGAGRLLEDLAERGAEAAVPSRRSRTAPRAHDREVYGWRHLAESLFAKTGELRAIATRCARTGESFAAGIASSPAWSPRHDCQRALATAGSGPAQCLLSGRWRAVECRRSRKAALVRGRRGQLMPPRPLVAAGRPCPLLPHSRKLVQRDGIHVPGQARIRALRRFPGILNRVFRSLSTSGQPSCPGWHRFRPGFAASGPARQWRPR